MGATSTTNSSQNGYEKHVEWQQDGDLGTDDSHALPLQIVSILICIEKYVSNHTCIIYDSLLIPQNISAVIRVKGLYD